MKMPASLGAEWNMITTPDDLKKFYSAIAEGKSKQSLLVLGPTSTGKTEIAKKAFKFVYPGDEFSVYGKDKHKYALYFDGGGTPAELYTHAYRYANRTLFIDDPTSGFLQEKAGKRLFKQLFATSRGPRQITWRSKANFLEQEELEPSFWTESTVITVMNELRGVGPDMDAIKARCTCIYYAPSLQTRLEYADEWVSKEPGGKEIMNWVWKQYKRGTIRQINQRNLYLALDYKQTEDKGLKTLDWKEYLLRVCHDVELDEPSEEDRDANILHDWVAQHTNSGVFTVSYIAAYCWPLRDKLRRERAIQRALDKGIIHLLPPPRRPKGDRTRQPTATYCLGKKSDSSIHSNLSILPRTELSELSELSESQEAAPKSKKKERVYA